jgi:hypothetical protein
MLRRYRVLWVFGFLFALTGGAGSTNFNFNSGSPRQSGQFPNFPSGSVDWNTVITIAAIVLGVLLVLAIVGTIVRYMAETALMAGADEIEATGAAPSVRQGFRLGWSRQAWRLFLTDLVILVPVAVAAGLLVVAAATPLLLWLTRQTPIGIMATVVTVALEALVIIFLVIVGLALSVVMPYLRRRVVLGRQGPLAALRQSVNLVRASLLDTGLMWLLLAAIRIVWSLVSFPVILVLFILAAIIGGVPAGIAYLVSHTWVWAAIVGAPLFLLMLIPSTAFVEGMFEAYVSASWTLTYREVAGKFSEQLVAGA